MIKNRFFKIFFLFLWIAIILVASHCALKANVKICRKQTDKKDKLNTLQ